MLACLFWGLSFTWAKTVGETVNGAVGAGPGATLGPLWGLAVRFGIAALLWIAIVPAARTGWTIGAVRHGVWLGLLMSAAIIVQHLGLEHSGAAITAFLTSLTVVFVPLLSWAVTRRRPSNVIWMGVVLATVGVWLMTGATAEGFGIGELLGLICSICWAVYIFVIAHSGLREHPARMVAAQFIVAAVLSGGLSLMLAGERLPAMVAATIDPRVWQNVLLLALFATVAAFGILTYQQPKIDAVRASLIYLAEPIFAAAFAWAWAGHGMTATQIGGAVLILVANVAVEVIAGRESVVVPD